METQNECWSFKNYKHNTEVKAQSDHKYIVRLYIVRLITLQL